MARAATETQKAGLTGLEFGLAIPGTVGGAVWANAGAHERDVAAVLESADVLLADGTRGAPAGGGAGPRLPREPVQATPTRGPRAGRARPRRDVPADRRAGRRHRRRLDEIRRWRQAHQPLGHALGRQRLPQPAGWSVGRRAHRRPRASRAAGSAARSCQREARQLHRQRPEGHGGRRPRASAERVRDEVARRTGIGPRVRDRLPRRLAGGWPVDEPAPDRRGRRRRRPARRPVGRARRVDRVRDGDRRRPGRRGPARRAGPDRPRRRAGGGCRPTIAAGRPAGGRLRRSGGARRDGPGDRRAPPSTGSPRPRSAAGRVHRAPRPVRRGRHRPGAARGGRARLHGIGRDGVGARHGQGGVQATRPRHRAAGRRLARDPGRPLGAPIARRSSPSSRRSRPAPATRG